VTRYTMNPDGRSCEFAIVVADAWQHKGIGSRLLRCLMEAARDRGLQSMEGEILADNQPMLRLITALGFTVRTSGEDAGVRLAQKAL